MTKPFDAQALAHIWAKDVLKDGLHEERLTKVFEDVYAAGAASVQPKPEKPSLGTFFWICKECKKEFEWEINKLSHSPFDIASCLACTVKAGDRIPMYSCPDCRNKKGVML